MSVFIDRPTHSFELKFWDSVALAPLLSNMDIPVGFSSCIDSTWNSRFDASEKECLSHKEEHFIFELHYAEVTKEKF